MHAANQYLSSIGKLAVGSVLSTSERQNLELRLREDAKDYYQAALVSIVDGLRSISDGFFSWATVELYYAVFYSLRSRLALSGECVLYEGHSPRLMTTAAGAVVSKLSGNTHHCVLKHFSRTFPLDFFLSQTIELIEPLVWLEDRRTDVNYRNSRFCEPVPPTFLSYAAATDRRQMLGGYLIDDVYVHDPDHAMVAFPFRLVVDLRSRLTAQGLVPLQQAELEFIQSKMTDRIGRITAMSSVFI